jgi:hypothetical protein
MRDQRQRGGVMIMVMVILAALLAGGAVALYVQTGSTRATGLTRFSRSALFCAEAGLNATRAVIINNYTSWNDVLDPDVTNPTWYGTSGIEGDAGDGDPNDPDADWRVTIFDNDDEFPNPDPERDNDLKIFVRSECLMYPDQPRVLLELIRYDLDPEDYESKCKGGQCTNDQTQ